MFVHTYRADGKHRQGRQVTAFRLVMKGLAEGVSVGPDGQKMFARHDGAQTFSAGLASIRTGPRWNAEWSRVAPVIGCRSLAHLLGLTRFEQEAARAPGGLTVAVENALKKARERFVLPTEATRATVPDLSFLGRRYARAFARRLAARGGHRLLQTRGGVVELLRGLEAGFRECGLSRLARILVGAQFQAGEEKDDDEAGTGAQ